MDFGLAYEGITGHITIENILCGYFNDIDDLDENIVYLHNLPLMKRINSKVILVAG